MSDFADQLEQELLHAARSRAARGLAARRSDAAIAVSRRLLRAAPAAVSVIVALVIGVGALALLGARHSPVAHPGAQEAAVVERVVADYAILRRAQTVADRALPLGLAPSGHVLPQLTRLLGTFDGHRVFVAVTDHPVLMRRIGTRDGHGEFTDITGHRFQLTGYVITLQGTGAGEGSFKLFPTRGATPAIWQLGRRSLAFVPDSVTRVIWRSDLGTLISTRPHHNIDYGPYPLGSWGVTLYAGSRELAEVAVPLAQIRLKRPASASNETATAIIQRDAPFRTRRVTSIRILAAHVTTSHRNVYGVWLYSTLTHEHFLGFLAPVIWPKTDEIAQAVLPRNYHSYRNLLITQQPHHGSMAPGEILLRGNIPRR